MSDPATLTEALLSPAITAQARQNTRANMAAVAVQRYNPALFPQVVDFTSDLALPLVIPANSTWTSPLLPSFGVTHVAFAVQANQGGVLTLAKFLDQFGTFAAGTATQSVVANVTSLLDHVSTTLFQSYTCAIQNTATSAMTISGADGVLS
jgi:hypothetical protein